MLLDNSQFDDGSLECRNFTLIWDLPGGDEFVTNYEWEDVKRFIPGAVEPIIEAFKAGKRYVFWKFEDGTIEIQWD